MSTWDNHTCCTFPSTYDVEDHLLLGDGSSAADDGDKEDDGRTAEAEVDGDRVEVVTDDVGEEATLDRHPDGHAEEDASETLRGRGKRCEGRGKGREGREGRGRGGVRER